MRGSRFPAPGRGATYEAWARQRLPEVAAPALVIHAAVLAHGGSATLCCGVPGAGKSTLAGLLPDMALGEELALLHPRGGDGPVVEVLPVRGERGGGARLAAVLILEHGREHRLTPLAPGAAVRAVARHVYWPTEAPAALGRAFGGLVEVLASVPVYRLAFRPESGVRKVLLEALG